MFMVRSWNNGMRCMFLKAWQFNGGAKEILLDLKCRLEKHLYVYAYEIKILRSCLLQFRNGQECVFVFTKNIVFQVRNAENILIRTFQPIVDASINMKNSTFYQE